MAKQHRVTLNGQTFQARSGQVLLDAATVSGTDIPHDCRAGRCGTCVTRVNKGITLGGETMQRGMVHACQARVFSDLDLSVEALPAVSHMQARVASLTDVTADVVELEIEPAARFQLLPGQYCRFTFRGFPERAFSPTAPLDGEETGHNFRLNIKRVRNGRVSTNLGGKIKVGHPLTINGPFGHAFLRPRQSNRIVLVAGGTGFAPMWAVGDASLREHPWREIVLIAGTRELNQLYMLPALELARRFPNVTTIATTETAQDVDPSILRGRPSDHLPRLRSNDIVYAAGAPAMVEAVGVAATAAHATFYADPFEPAGSQAEDWLTKAVSWLRTG
jgi:CDP-4-dehydro-6-deoxyglucose reductase, E3